MGLGSAPTVSVPRYLINNGIDNLWAKQANSDTPAIVSFTIQDADLGVIQNVTFSSPRIVMQQSQIVFQFRIESGTFMAKNQTPSSIDLSGFRLAYPASLSNSTLDTTTALYKQMQSKMAVPGNYSINQLLINLPVSTDSTFWANPLPSLTSFGANSGNVTPAIMKILGVLLAVKFAGLKSLGLLASGYSAQVANPASITDHPPTFVPTYAHMQSYPWIAQSPLSQPSFGLQGNARLNSLCFMEMTQGRVAPTGSDVDVPFNGNWTTSIPPTLATYRVLPTNTFTVAASSAQSCNEPTKALDSSNMTFWHTQYSPTLTQYPHSITIDMHTTQLVNGLTYLPRQDTTPNGRIAKYSIQLSINGLSWGPDVAVGTFANDTSLKQVFFSSSYARVVRLTALSEVSGNAWASAAEINILSGALNKSDWQVSADSAESGFSASNASDQSMDTIWHTSYSGNPAYPHTFTIDLYQMASKVGWKPISGLVYTPRQDITRNGTIGKFSIRVSGDMTKWTTLASDRWVDDRSSKVVRWAPTPGRYFQLQAISEAGNRGPWASAAAIDLLDGSGQIADSTSTDFGYFGLSRASFFDRYLIPKLRVLNAGLEAFIAGLTVDMSDWSAPLW
ncbi:uncharacterized protein KY384_006720 [Bacidia gigantensis]|uniref:uncharacterized protein n=1 Tax=Bacidia gigantensis TaxID=2732470 RepID=UPI001D05B385|nr:uncharacterized protein KY384_006720 [Bacidia gigantensis]KAG8529030.1 hypothetical protein KY384_006720 [Bacidia gigantensis]